ncbi:MAG: double-stranded RNA binding motif domain-containing protein [Cyanobacteria bacterium P01_A01_bin.17]
MARHRACHQWLNQFIQRQLVGKRAAWEDDVEAISQDAGNVQTHPDAPLAESPNYIGTLLELCQARGWKQPIFEFEAQESGFSCLCRLDYAGHVVEGVAIATQKKRAKQQAAMEVLSMMDTDNEAATKGK